MAQRAVLPAEVSRSAIQLARAIAIAMRSWGFYPPEHPAVGLAVDRLAAAVRDATETGPIQLAITPRTLLIDGIALESNDLSVAECAALLHDRDLLQVAFLGHPPEAVLRSLLAVLSLDREARRARGGPAAVWAEEGDTSVLLEQIDYQQILEREADEGVSRRDATWKAIVRSIISGRTSFTVAEQQRLLEISRDVGAIGELTRDCGQPFTLPDGSPLQTTQSAAVLAVYQHIAQTVAVLESGRTAEVMGSLALATSALTPGVAFELLAQRDQSPGAGTGVGSGTGGGTGAGGSVGGGAGSAGSGGSGTGGAGGGTGVGAGTGEAGAGARGGSGPNAGTRNVAAGAGASGTAGSGAGAGTGEGVGASAASGDPMVGMLRRSMDDHQVAMLLARAVATQGHATTRLAHVLDTVSPDQERRLRVVRMAQKLIGERDFGSRRPIDDIRQSFDELLLKYDERTFVSRGYKSAIDQAGAQAGDLLMRGLPAEMDDWLATLGHENVRRLSALLLTDLLRNETSAERVGEIARDMARFVEDLLMAGAFEEGLPVVSALKAAETRQPPLSPTDCRAAIDAVGESLAFAEAASALDEHTADEANNLGRLALAIGPASVLGLLAAYTRDDVGTGGERATNIIGRLGLAGIPRITAAADDARWYVQREMARALGQIGTAAAVPPLQALVRRSDLRVVQAAVSALARIDDPSAARALHTTLKATSGETRAAVIAALVGQKDPRVVPMLARILGESDPFGDEHPMVLETLGALASLRDDRAVPAISLVARKKRWLAWGRMRAVRESAVRALLRIGSATATKAVDDLARTGDFFLRRLARSLARGAA